jgi:P27 family predicted phage terminase small subunit
LWTLGLLSVLDTACLAAYCQTYSRWREAEEALAGDCDGGLLITTQDGNPLVKISADAAADMERFANEFGLTAVARSRLAGGVYGQPPPNKFDGLLAGPNNVGEK